MDDVGTVVFVVDDDAELLALDVLFDVGTIVVGIDDVPPVELQTKNVVLSVSFV